MLTCSHAVSTSERFTGRKLRFNNVVNISRAGSEMYKEL